MKNETQLRNCEWCEKPVRGRSDKRFCDDICRNAFNNQRNIGEYNIVRRINYALIRNRRILSKLSKAAAEPGKISREQLLEQGFQFKYWTHIQPTQSGDPCYFCYDFGYHPLPQDLFLVMRHTNKS